MKKLKKKFIYNYRNYVRPNVLEFIKKRILSKYDPVDITHGLAHIRDTIKISMDISKVLRKNGEYAPDFNLVVFIAAVHDIGRYKKKYKDNHAEGSYRWVVKHCKEISELGFTKDEVMFVIAGAVRQHSATTEYDSSLTTIYHKIIYDADKLSRFPISKMVNKWVCCHKKQAKKMSKKKIVNMVTDGVDKKFGKKGKVNFRITDSDVVKECHKHVHKCYKKLKNKKRFKAMIKKTVKSIAS